MYVLSLICSRYTAIHHSHPSQPSIPAIPATSIPTIHPNHPAAIPATMITQWMRRVIKSDIFRGMVMFGGGCVASSYVLTNMYPTKLDKWTRLRNACYHRTGVIVVDTSTMPEVHKLWGDLIHPNRRREIFNNDDTTVFFVDAALLAIQLKESRTLNHSDASLTRKWDYAINKECQSITGESWSRRQSQYNQPHRKAHRDVIMIRSFEKIIDMEGPQSVQPMLLLQRLAQDAAATDGYIVVVFIENQCMANYMPDWTKDGGPITMFEQDNR